MKYVDPNGQIHEKAWDFLAAVAHIKFESLIGENNVIAMNEAQHVQHQLPEIKKADDSMLTHIEIDSKNNQLIAYNQTGEMMGKADLNMSAEELSNRITNMLESQFPLSTMRPEIDVNQILENVNSTQPTDPLSTLET